MIARVLSENLSHFELFITATWILVYQAVFAAVRGQTIVPDIPSTDILVV